MNDFPFYLRARQYVNFVIIDNNKKKYNKLKQEKKISSVVDKINDAN